ncbi:MAG: serine hydrolase domain-containing protein [Gemmatimonadaceae bacterium]
MPIANGHSASILIVFACLAMTAPSVQTQSITRLDGSTISAAYADSFARRILAENKVTGAEIAIVNDGRIVWSAAYGQRHHDPSRPMDNETVTWAASITKSVFATYVMSLVERGQFDLDVPIATQLRAPLDTYEQYREIATELVKDPAWPRVTPRILLAHTSGLGNLWQFAKDKKLHLLFPPGSKYSYSGDGINLVQFVIEQKFGTHLDTLMADAIFTPLGMSRTGMIYRTAFESNVADRFGIDDNFLAQTRRYPARGAGSMMSTAEDIARFAAALLNDRIITPKTRAAMLKPSVEIRTLHQFAIAENEPPGKEAADVGLAYGVGWGLLTKTRFGPAFFKEGHGDGAQNYMICFERSRSCMIVLTNSDNGELAFRPLFETLLGDTVTPWEWEGYTPSYIMSLRGR